MGKSDEEIAELTKELRAVELPQGVGYLIEIFRELSDARTYGFAGNPNPISYLEIKAYADLLDLTLSAWEVQVIKQMDSAFVTEHAKLQASRTPNESAKPPVQG